MTNVSKIDVELMNLLLDDITTTQLVKEIKKIMIYKQKVKEVVDDIALISVREVLYKELNLGDEK